MRHLLLMRHAKAEPGAAGVADRNRPLAPRGLRDAALVGAALAADALTPDLVLCSPARRTRQTLDAVLERLSATPEVRIVDALYGAGEETYAGVIADLGGAAERLMVVGHNPTIHLTAVYLAGTGDNELRRHMAAKFPTGAVAVLTFPGTAWSETTPAGGDLTTFLRPRDLGSEADD